MLGQPHAVIGEAQGAEHKLGQLHRGPELAAHLVVGAEQVGVVLGEAADPGHARDLARLLVAVYRAELGQTQGQVAIAPRLGGVDLDVVRTVHRLEQILLVVAGPLEVADPLGDAHREERPGHPGFLLAIRPGLDFGQPFGDAGLAQQRALGVLVQRAGDQTVQQLLGCVVREHLQRWKLAVAVLGIVAAGLVQVDLADVGGVDGLVPTLDQLGLHESFQDTPDDGPLGHPEDQPPSDQWRDCEQAQLLADLAVIALPGLFELRQMGIEILLVEEGGAVDALEHLAVGLPFPVGAGDGEELERPDLAGMRNVRAAAEIDELALAIEAEHAELVQLVVDVFDLERLAQVGDELAGLVHRQ